MTLEVYMKYKAAIVIPIYKSELSETERISLKQASRIFKKEKKFFVLPASLKYSYMSEEIVEIRLNDRWFQSVRSYNDLILSEDFYRRFLEYEYVLIYQLDAFVFSNELERFCRMGYDYIGAPWIDGTFYYRDGKHIIWYVGNGGFSLRKVESMIKILSENREALKDNRTNEDLILSSLAGELFRVAPMDIALEFAFEMNVKESYERNKRRLPFGCHAWHSYDLSFWKPWIENFGYHITEQMCMSGQKDISLYGRRKEVSRFWLSEYKKENLALQLRELFGSENGGYAIWGAGYWGQTLCRMLEDAGLNVECFIDRQNELRGRRIFNRDVISPEMIREKIERCRIIVAVIEGCEEITAWLKGIDYKHCRNYIYLQDIDIVYKNIIL